MSIKAAYISSLKSWARLIRSGDITPEDLANDLDKAVAYIRESPPTNPKWGQFEVMPSAFLESDGEDFCVATTQGKVYVKDNGEGISVDIYGHGADNTAASCRASSSDLGGEATLWLELLGSYAAYKHHQKGKKKA